MDVSWSEVCPRCDYPLATWNARCSECGLPPPGKERGWRYDGEHDLFRLFRRRSVAPAVLCVITVGFGFAFRAGLVRHGGTIMLVLAGCTAAYAVLAIRTLICTNREAMSETVAHRETRGMMTLAYIMLSFSVCAGCVLLAALLSM